MNVLIRIVAALTFLLALTFAHPPTADAAQVYSPAGRPGPVNLNGPMVTGYDFQTRLADGRYLTTKSWEASGFSVGRSPAYNGSQDIVAVYALQRFVDGRWTTWVQRQYSGRTSGGAITFPRWVYSPPTLQDRRYGYRVVYVLGWFVAGTNQHLGSESIIPSTTADNRCQMRFGTRCDAYWDGIVF